MNSILIRKYFPPVSAFFIGGAILLMLHTHGHVIEPVFLRYLLIWLPVVFFIAVYPRKDTGTPVTKEILAAVILIAFMVLYLFSSCVDYPWFYFLSWLPRNTFGFHLLESPLGQFVFFTALLTPLLIVRPRWPAFWLLALLLLTQAGSAFLFMQETGGAALYHDDHSSTLYRLWEFCGAFPRQVNYNPYWNGGQISNHPVLTGTAAIGMFCLPFWKWLPIELFYTPLLAVVFIGIVPLLAFFSMRIIGADWTAAGCAGILALGTSQFDFLWLLYYGTVGAVFSAACLMPASACLYRIFILDKREWWLAVTLIIAGCFLLMWPPNAILALVLLVTVLLNARLFSWRKMFFLTVCAAGIIFVSLPRIIVIIEELLQGSYGGTGASPSAAAPSFIKMLAGGYGNLVDYIRMGHPLLIFLGLGGVIVAVNPDIRRFFLPLVLLMIVVTGWGPEIMPDFQLFRMNTPLFFAAVIPAAFVAGELLHSGDSRPAARLPSASHGSAWLALFRAALAAILIVGALNTMLLFGNHSRAPYKVLSHDGHKMVEWIRSNTPEDTRVLFTGATIHGYEDGHVAFLQYLTGREMMACDYYHFSPRAVEYDYPHQPWRKSAEMFNRFLDLYNVSIVTTLHNARKAYLRSRPDEYGEEISFGENNALTFFKVKRPPPSLFLVGQGKVKANFNRIDVELTGNNEQAVIKYNWQPGLAAEGDVEIFPYNAGPGVRFIGIKPHGQKHVVIRYK